MKYRKKREGSTTIAAVHSPIHSAPQRSTWAVNGAAKKQIVVTHTPLARIE